MAVYQCVIVAEAAPCQSCVRASCPLETLRCLPVALLVRQQLTDDTESIAGA